MHFKLNYREKAVAVSWHGDYLLEKKCSVHMALTVPAFRIYNRAKFIDRATEKLFKYKFKELRSKDDSKCNIGAVW